MGRLLKYAIWGGAIYGLYYILVKNKDKEAKEEGKQLANDAGVMQNGATLMKNNYGIPFNSWEREFQNGNVGFKQGFGL